MFWGMWVLEGEKSMVFWVGLIIFSMASVVLFGVLWMVAVVMHPASRFEFLKGLVPLIVGGIVFVIIGICMMRSAVKKQLKIQTAS